MLTRITYCFACIFTLASIYQCHPRIQESKISNNEKLLLEYHMKCLDSCIFANPGDTVFRCCNQSINYIVQKTKIEVTTDVGLPGRTSFSITDKYRWNKWCKDYLNLPSLYPTIIPIRAITITKARLIDSITEEIIKLPDGFYLLLRFESNDIKGFRDTTNVLINEAIYSLKNFFIPTRLYTIFGTNKMENIVFKEASTFSDFHHFLKCDSIKIFQE